MPIGWKVKETAKVQLSSVILDTANQWRLYHSHEDRVNISSAELYVCLRNSLISRYETIAPACMCLPISIWHKEDVLLWECWRQDAAALKYSKDWITFFESYDLMVYPWDNPVTFYRWYKSSGVWNPTTVWPLQDSYEHFMNEFWI